MENEMKNTHQQAGFSLIELLIVVAMIGIIASLAVPNMLASRRAANEGSAISSLRAIFSAQSTYLSTAGAGNYGTLVQLGAHSYIDETLTAGSKSGYTFLCPDTNLTVGSPPTFFSTGHPSDINFATRTGNRSFSVAEDGMLRGKSSDAGPATHAAAVDTADWPPVNQ
jgi:type IV pilus assembly protein PilA